MIGLERSEQSLGCSSNVRSVGLEAERRRVKARHGESTAQTTRLGNATCRAELENACAVLAVESFVATALLQWIRGPRKAEHTHMLIGARLKADNRKLFLTTSHPEPPEQAEEDEGQG